MAATRREETRIKPFWEWVCPFCGATANKLNVSMYARKMGRRHVKTQHPGEDPDLVILRRKDDEKH